MYCCLSKYTSIIYINYLNNIVFHVMTYNRINICIFFIYKYFLYVRYPMNSIFVTLFWIFSILGLNIYAFTRVYWYIFTSHIIIYEESRAFMKWRGEINEENVNRMVLKRCSVLIILYIVLRFSCFDSFGLLFRIRVKLDLLVLYPRRHLTLNSKRNPLSDTWFYRIMREIST